MQITKSLLFLITNFKDSKMRNFWYSLDEKIRFLLVGGFNFCVSYFIYAALCFIFGENIYQIALCIAWILSSFVSFTTQKFLVFRGKDKWYKEYFKCCTTWFFSYLINAGLLQCLVKLCGLNVYLGQFFATLTTAIFTYILFKKFAFKRVI